ncbi:MAG: phosphohistidine phosphatase SixA [Gammaproteobacteria bacterium]
MRLYLVQHGAALPSEADPARPLSDSGWQDVQAMAKFLNAAGIRVERVWHSGKLRAEQTAHLLAKAVMPRGKIEQVGGLGPNDDVAGFVSDADVWEQDILVAGHLPFLSRLVARLVTGNPEHQVVGFLPGSVVCLERCDIDRWMLLWMIRPELLVRH